MPYGPEGYDPFLLLIFSGLVFALGVSVRSLIERTIEHKFHRDLEDLKSSLRRSEEELRGQLKARDDQISALRAAALAELGRRTALVETRRIEAAERLWAAAVDLGKITAAAKMIGVLKVDSAIKMAAKQDAEGQAVRAFADTLWKAFKLDDLRPAAPSDKERPFIAPFAWACFHAYRSVLHRAVVELAAMRLGIGPDALADPKPTIEAVRLALPSYSNFIDTYGATALPHLVEQLEEAVLASVISSLDGSSEDASHVKRAKSVLSDIEKFRVAEVGDAEPQLPSPPANLKVDNELRPKTNQEPA